MHWQRVQEASGSAEVVWGPSWIQSIGGRLKHAFFGLVTFLLVLLLAEVMGYAFFYLAHRDLPHRYGWRTFKTPRMTMLDHPYLPYYGTAGLYGQVSLNSMGDRGPDPEVPKRRIRIVCFGGSTTFGQDDPWEQTWPGILQEMLGDGFEVLSAAHNGDTTADTLVKLTLIYQDLQPDLVLVYHGTNDLETSYAEGFRPDYAHRRRDVGPTPYPVFDRLPRWLDYSSYFVALRAYLVGYRGSMWSLYSRTEVRTDLQNGPFGLDTFRRNLRSMDAVSRLVGARLVVGTFQYYQPWAEEYHGPEWAAAWRRGLDLQNDIIRGLAASEDNIFLAEVERAFEPTPAHMTDFCHLTPLGNREIARTYAEAVRAALP